MAKITVIGAGAVGLSVGAALIEAGHELTFAVRETFATLRINATDEAARSFEVSAITDFDAAPEADWVLLCVKAHQVDGAADWLKATVGPATRVAVLQNGVEHRARVTPYVSPETLIVPVVVDVPSARSAPGIVEWHKRALLTVADTPEGRAFCDLFTGTFVEARVSADYVTENWKKLCVNAPGGAVLALTGQPMRVFHKPGIADIARAILSECVAVGRAEGANLPDDLIEQQMQRFMNATPEGSNSMYDDWLKGVETEWDARNGVLSRLGRKHGIATPFSDVIVPLLAAQTA